MRHHPGTIDFGLLPQTLADDVENSLAESLVAGAVFERGTSPIEVFEHAVGAAIRDIRDHTRGKLLQRFVVQGPYKRPGEIPAHLAGQRLTDDEAAKAVAFIFSSMVNSFQGRLAELLAAGPISGLLRRLPNKGGVDKLYIGDAVTAPQSSSRGRAKAADVQALATTVLSSGELHAAISLIGEIKSYPASEKRVRAQLGAHLARARHGLVIGSQRVDPDRVSFDPDPPIMIWVTPAGWCLPRTFHFEEVDGRTVLHVEEPGTPPLNDEWQQAGDGLWHLTLRWSHEALAAAAYTLTFWYMEEIGHVAFSDPKANPWPEMTPAEAGRNAATQAIYYAILRARTNPENDRAVALYNMYGFGYALGMNFRGSNGRRKMLWPEDLREILRNGRSDEGFVIAG